jgi:Fungal specific transcription factor domain
MDLFDFGTYFSSRVPIKALTHPLLKYAACACAAKQLGRINVSKHVANHNVHLRARARSTFSDGSNQWYWCGAKYYDKAIQILMKTLQSDGLFPDSANDDETSRDQVRATPSALRGHAPFSDPKSDEVLAATAILCVYEFLDNTGPAWDRHLSGAKSLLDVAQRQMASIEDDSWARRSPAPCLTFSQARRAIFWNFARQDYLSGRKCLS